MILSSPATISAEELTALLRAKGWLTSGSVAAMEWEPVGNGLLGDTLRCSLTYDRENTGGPASVLGKFPPADLAIRAGGVALGVYQTEVGFYREIAPHAQIAIPDCLYADIDAEGGNFGLLMEDLSPARMADQFAGCSLQEAELAVKEIAKLHASHWNDPALTKIGWMQTYRAKMDSHIATIGQRVPLFLERFPVEFDAREMAVIEQGCRLMPRLYHYPHRNVTMLHGDFRLDNILFDGLAGKRPITVLDWQLVSIGPGVTDITFFLSTSLPADIRRAHERDLLTTYLEILHRNGVTDYDFAQLWADCRLAAWQTLSTAVGASLVAKRTARADAMFVGMAKQGVALLEDFGTLTALD